MKEPDLKMNSRKVGGILPQSHENQEVQPTSLPAAMKSKGWMAPVESSELHDLVHP
jgi:hypothetical protein